MAYITGLGQLVKGQRQEIYFDKGAFIFATNFATNTYFADDLNWSKVALHFFDPTKNQRNVVILMDDESRGWFAPSVTCRTGDWTIEKISIFDKDGDFFEVQKENIPNAAEIKAKVVRIVAPSTQIAGLTNANQTIVLPMSGEPASEASNWKAGFKFKLWSVGDNAYLSEDVYTITNIIDNTLVLDKAVIGDITGKTIVMRFPNYSQVSGEQASKYEYVGVGY